MFGTSIHVYTNIIYYRGIARCTEHIYTSTAPLKYQIYTKQLFTLEGLRGVQNLSTLKQLNISTLYYNSIVRCLHLLAVSDCHKLLCNYDKQHLFFTTYKARRWFLVSLKIILYNVYFLTILYYFSCYNKVDFTKWSAVFFSRYFRFRAELAQVTRAAFLKQ